MVESVEERREAGSLAEQGDLERACRVPRLAWWWEWPCWGAFSVGVAVVVFSLCALESGERRGVVFAALSYVPAASLALAGVNTMLAAKGFASRRRAIRRWLSEHMYRVGSAAEGVTGSVGENDEHRVQVTFDARLKHLSSGGWLISTRRGLSPGPFREGGMKLATFRLDRYLDMIDAETRAARVDAARLVGAMAGLFVASFAVYERLGVGFATVLTR